MIETFEISDVRAAALFAGATSRSILLELVAREQTLSGLRKALGLSLSLLHYHVSRMAGLGLVTVASENRPTGRPRKTYRAVARAFFVPAHLERRDARRALALELNAALEQARARSREDGVLYSWDQTNGPRMKRIGGDRVDGAELWGRLTLSDKEAAQLGSELRDVLGRYQSSSMNGKTAYLAHFAFARR
jgi:DNA-binding transcriptional ArsR family regulator